MKRNMMIFPALLMALPLVGCSVGIGGEIEESWENSDDGAEAKAAYQEFFLETYNTEHMKVTTVYPSGDSTVEEIDGTSEYRKDFSNNQLDYETWLFVEENKYYVAYNDIEEEEKYYVVNKDYYDTDYKDFADCLTVWWDEDDTDFEYVNKGSKKTKDGVSTGTGSMTFITRDNGDYVKIEATTDGTKMLEATVTTYFSEDQSTDVYRYTFDYKANFTFAKPDLNGFTLDR